MPIPAIHELRTIQEAVEAFETYLSRHLQETPGERFSAAWFLGRGTGGQLVVVALETSMDRDPPGGWREGLLAMSRCLEPIAVLSAHHVGWKGDSQVAFQLEHRDGSVVCYQAEVTWSDGVVVLVQPFQETERTHIESEDVFPLIWPNMERAVELGNWLDTWQQ